MRGGANILRVVCNMAIEFKNSDGRLAAPEVCLLTAAALTEVLPPEMTKRQRTPTHNCTSYLKATPWKLKIFITSFRY